MIFKLLLSLEKISYGTPSVKEFEVVIMNAKIENMRMTQVNYNFLKKSFAGFYIRL